MIIFNIAYNNIKEKNMLDFITIVATVSFITYVAFNWEKIIDAGIAVFGLICDLISSK